METKYFREMQLAQGKLLVLPEIVYSGSGDGVKIPRKCIFAGSMYIQRPNSLLSNLSVNLLLG